jgi:hypothetical protein
VSSVLVLLGIGRASNTIGLFVLASVLLVSAASAESCADAIEVDGVYYEAASFERTPSFGGALGTGRNLCPASDEHGCSADAVEEVIVQRIPGVEPAVAVGAVGPFGPTVYLAAGFFPQLPKPPVPRRDVPAGRTG